MTVRTAFRYTVMRTAVIVATTVSLAAHAAAPAAPARTSIIREGLWVLNQARSKKLTPGTQTLWIVKDDGDHMIWVSVERDLNNMVRVSSWDGRYDGQPVEVIGTGMIARLTSAGPGRMRSYGDIPKLGKYSEDCVVSSGGKRMRCEGRVEMADGIKTYIDDFDWLSLGPRCSGMARN